MWAGRRRRGGEGLIWVPPPAIVRGAGRPCEPIRTQHVNKQAGQVRVTPELSVRTRERVQTPLTGTQRGADSERNPWLCSGTGEKRRIAGRSTLTMTSCHHHSGYLADDEAGHTTYVARPPKKPPFLEMGQAYKSGHMPHPPSRYTHADSSGLRGHRRNPRDPRPFGSFLDFLVEGQVLDSLQTVVEEATERMTTMKTEAGVPLVEVQDPIEVPRGGQRVRARPSLSTVHRHRARPSLCTGRPNNYPSSSSSMSDSHSSFTAGWLGSHSQDSDLGARGMGSLPPMRDKLLLEKNLKRLLKLENRGKGIGRSCFQTDSLLWDSLGSQASSQRTQEPPLSWFSGLLGSSTGTAQTSELGPVERELTFLKRERCKEIKSLLNQPASFDLPGYCSFREPHRTLDFLAEHHLFPALQSVVRQAVDKLSGARRHDGCPLFPSEWEPATEPNSDSVQDSKPEPNSDSVQDSKPATPTDGEETYNVLPIRVSSSKMIRRKSTKGRGQAKSKSPNYRFVKKTLPSISSKSTLSHFPNPVYEELVSYLVEKVVSLVIYKYKFEKNLSKQLGFISFPVTETLMDLFLGFKKVKGSRICLSSKINWNCLLRKLEEAEWARQLSRQASQHDSASQRSSQRGPAHQGAGHSSTESPSTGPEPAPRADPAEAAEPSLDSELPDLRLLWAQEDAGAEEQGPTSVGANQSQELVDGDSQSNEEEDEDQGEDFPDEGTPQSSPRASSGGGRQRLHEHESQ
ncbi:coiled-coil domain-containing protein 116 isoform X1 [Canis lupus familiaris]|uniref:Coiled-coil domain containing 116 n=3 Tax=Canis lupus familiaris TaxID=9615 RepID=A0A8I3PSC2_CANLF|nr:coiled-coil domain-containing protein 116 isoform X1 [Canis lupus familiaris]